MTDQAREIAGELSEGLYDKHGREIMIGDIIKVFHFIGARRKRHYMYKQVIREGVFSDEAPYFILSHLSMNDSEYYHESKDGRLLSHYEIVQSIDAAFEDRPRVRASLSDTTEQR
ncbi:MAG TPA: hypothetical protein VKB96_11095 [Gammaproteobacteria bacterium]|nr:hypothetical protein [Gammaproteobacteria bacterium]